MDNTESQKKNRLLTALQQGMVMIHLDARRPGVCVPDHLRTETHLRLNLSYRFEPPDLTVTEWGIRSTLSFQGTRFKVAIPWCALFAVTSHATKEFWVYPEDVPAELFSTAPRSSLRSRSNGAPVQRCVLHEVARNPEDRSSCKADERNPRPNLRV